MVTRGQAYTLEGVLAAILVVTATVYGLQAIDTRAWEDNTREETHQLENQASDVLTLAGESGALRNATVCYRPGRPIEGDRNQTRTEFEQMLNTTFDSQANDYNLYLSYWNGTGRETVLASQPPDSDTTGPPASAAVASTTVTITDNTSQREGANCAPFLSVKETENSFYMDDAAPDSALFNVVEVRLVVW